MERPTFFCYEISGHFDCILNRNICDQCVKSLDYYTILNLVKFNRHETVNSDLTYNYSNIICCDVCQYKNLVWIAYCDSFIDSRCTQCKDHEADMHLLINEMDKELIIVEEIEECKI